MKKTVFLAADICHSAATKVDEGDIVVNNPSELMIIIPALPAGTYQLKITTQYSMGKQWSINIAVFLTGNELQFLFPFFRPLDQIIGINWLRRKSA